MSEEGVLCNTLHFGGIFLILHGFLGTSVHFTYVITCDWCYVGTLEIFSWAIVIACDLGSDT